MEKSRKANRSVLCGVSAVGAAVAGTLIFGAAPARAADYTRQLVTTYFGQETANEPGKFYCGAATGQMILATTGVGKNPAPIVGPPAQSTQDQIYTTAKANYGVNGGNYFMNPAGLRGALATYDPPGPRTYVSYTVASYDSSNRILAYDVDHYSVTAGALLYRGGHWVNTYGVDTNTQPTLTNVGDGSLKINGFDIHDPWTGTHGGGLGKNAFLANAYKKNADNSLTPIGKWNTNFTTTNWGGTYQGNYCFVADPDPGSDSTLDSASIEAPALGTALDGPGAITDAGSDLSTDSNLSTDPSFEGGAFSSNSESEITDQFSGDQDWIVPYFQSGDTLDASGAALIDAQTGVLVAAVWDEGNLDSDPALIFSTELTDEDINNQTIPEASFETDNIPIPEPTTMSLLTLSGAMLLSRRRRVDG